MSTDKADRFTAGIMRGVSRQTPPHTLFAAFLFPQQPLAASRGVWEDAPTSTAHHALPYTSNNDLKTSPSILKACFGSASFADEQKKILRRV